MGESEEFFPQVSSGGNKKSQRLGWLSVRVSAATNNSEVRG